MLTQGEWSCWSDWSECSGGCGAGVGDGVGQQTRTRKCLSPNGCADAGAALEKRACPNNCIGQYWSKHYALFLLKQINKNSILKYLHTVCIGRIFTDKRLFSRERLWLGRVGWVDSLPERRANAPTQMCRWRLRRRTDTACSERWQYST